MSPANSFSLSCRPGTAVRYARYVGRVGALAVSLGVGFAVATTPGVARAEHEARGDVREVAAADTV